MSSSTLNPDSGARVLLELSRETDAHVEYRVSIHVPSDSFVGAAHIDVGTGAIAFAAWDQHREPPAWTVDQARAFLRTLHKNRADDGWPRRVLRWRQQRA